MNIASLIINFLVGIIYLLVVILHFYIVHCGLSEPAFEDAFSKESKHYNKKSQTYETITANWLVITSKTQMTEIGKDECFCKEYGRKNILETVLDCVSLGKAGRIVKLHGHTKTASPVLTYYGELIEHKELSFLPDYKNVLLNEDRNFVEKLDFKFFQIIDKKRDKLWNIHKNFLFDCLKKEAYYLQIYHTVGIDGNTMTLKQVRFLLETRNTIISKSLKEHNEVIDLEGAMSYIISLINNKAICLKEILEIHKRVIGHVDPLTNGRFRDVDAFVGSYKPPSPEDVYSLMEGYVEWLNSEEAQHMHPIRYAALAHYKLVKIYPFTGGNRRMSNLIMNLILIRSGYPQIFILKNQREKYYQYLTADNKKDAESFVRFIAHSLDQMLEAYLWILSRIHLKNMGNSCKITVSSEEPNYLI